MLTSLNRRTKHNELGHLQDWFTSCMKYWKTIWNNLLMMILLLFPMHFFFFNNCLFSFSLRCSFGSRHSRTGRDEFLNYYQLWKTSVKRPWCTSRMIMLGFYLTEVSSIQKSNRSLVPKNKYRVQEKLMYMSFWTLNSCKKNLASELQKINIFATWQWLWSKYVPLLWSYILSH